MVEIKEIFFQVMDDQCKSESLALATNSQIESRAFMLEEHAQAIREACEQGGYTVSFRVAGHSTLKLIGNGNPCKGHDISDKSIKKRDVKWNYAGQDAILSELEGCIGFSRNNQERELHGVWIESDNKPQKCHLAEVHNYTNTCYTGDYDMHDLLKYNGDKLDQIIPETEEDKIAIDYLNKYLLKSSANGSSKIKNDEGRDRYSKLQQFLDANPGRCSKDSGYSLIRHGAQTSYWFYLHCDQSRKELEKVLLDDTLHNFFWKNNIINIAAPICFFNNRAEAYILENIHQVYLYYKINGILEQIPFIYFFPSLSEIAKSNDKLSRVLDRNSELVAKWTEEYFL